MSKAYTILKKKSGGLVIFGGSNEEKSETIEIGRDDILGFVEGFAEYLELFDLQRLEVIVEDLIEQREYEEGDE